ncbi:hypothetical protein KY290_005813 [Solanum tuberosum]|uniref:Retrovirus-related Pol polyprotein from transposon TNT 1-94-like beta-barrel domain-containing protein n=1 Tax=Solanum tuberosum TaxID=4113 RepID=A0ABQ7WGK9_SOLTU|nr:hypothetical protein KY285_005709 [Solanum tuberosum]KAH0779386.1 hypothetical protein KY290_005813 [Solanum tuberosum]
MEDLLYVKNFYKSVFTTVKPDNKTDEEWNLLHRQGIMNQLFAMDIKFDEEIQGLLLLGSLPDSWETFRISLSNSAPDGVISMDFTKNSVLNEEMRRKSQGSSSSNETEEGEKNKEKTKEDGLATVTIEDLVTVLDADMINIACDESSWVVDTDAASHVTSRKDFFSSYTPGDFGTLSMGNETVSRVVGIGYVSINGDGK